MLVIIEAPYSTKTAVLGVLTCTPKHVKQLPVGLFLEVYTFVYTYIYI